MPWGLSRTTLPQLSRAFCLKEQGASHPLPQLQTRGLNYSLPAVHRGPRPDAQQRYQRQAAWTGGGAHCVPRGGSSSSASSPSLATDCQPSSMMRNPGGAPAACRLQPQQHPDQSGHQRQQQSGGGGALLPWGGKGDPTLWRRPHTAHSRT
jgi:hypothetical protein